MISYRAAKIVLKTANGERSHSPAAITAFQTASNYMMAKLASYVETSMGDNDRVYPKDVNAALAKLLMEESFGGE